MTCSAFEPGEVERLGRLAMEDPLPGAAVGAYERAGNTDSSTHHPSVIHISC